MFKCLCKTTGYGLNCVNPYICECMHTEIHTALCKRLIYNARKKKRKTSVNAYMWSASGFWWLAVYTRMYIF